MKISKEEVRLLVFGDSTELYESIEEGQWISEGKYEYCTTIFKDVLSNKYYRFSVSRTGSHYTDWYYDWEYQNEFEAEEVCLVTKTIEVWEKI